MEPSFIIAQILGGSVAVVAALTVQFKRMEHILIGQTLSNLLVALNYLLLGGLSGAGVCIVAMLQTVVIYFFRRKGKSFPLFLTLLFMLAYVACSVAYYKTPFDLLTCLAALLFALSVVQSRSSLCRVYGLFNALLWIVYDLSTQAYAASVTHAILLISTLVAMLRLDRNDWIAFFKARKNQ